MEASPPATGFDFDGNCRYLAKEYGYTPDDVADLTPYQAGMLLKG